MRNEKLSLLAQHLKNSINVHAAVKEKMENGESYCASMIWDKLSNLTPLLILGGLFNLFIQQSIMGDIKQDCVDNYKIAPSRLKRS